MSTSFLAPGRTKDIILGPSRRQPIGGTDFQNCRKIRTCATMGAVVVLCIGHTWIIRVLVLQKPSIDCVVSGKERD